MSDLAKKSCAACESGGAHLKGSDLVRLRADLKPGWTVIDEHHLEKEYNFKNFRDALTFTNAVGELAETENHHPDLFLTWGRVKVTIWTHKVGGLTESDFVLAAKIDTLPGQ